MARPTGSDVVEQWRIEMFGGLRAVSSNRTVRHFRTHRAGILLTYLALHRGTPCSRELLGEILWPGEDPVVQRNRLRYELTVLRTVLSDDILVRSGNTAITVPNTVETDVITFETQVRRALSLPDSQQRIAPLRQALDIYHDDLLPGITPPEDEEASDDWIARERTRLRDLHFDASVRYILDLEALGNTRDAEQHRRRTALRHPERSLPPSLNANPAQHDGFIGREEELAAILTWHDQENAPPLTLTGLGGIGKTSLARRAMQTTPATLVSIEGINGLDSLYVAVHAALGLPTAGTRPIRRQVREELRLRNRYLLILDGAEHAAREVNQFVAEILPTCPALRLLCTARRSLRLPNERTLPVGPLPHDTATALFLQKARAVRSTFAVTERGVRTAEEVVRLLDGVPLALELAAARALILGPEQMRGQLTEQLRFLVSIRPNRSDRHQSLRIALEWSVGSLSPHARRLLARLSVFQNRFPLEAVQQVTPDDTPHSPLDGLEELRLHALIETGIALDSEEVDYHLLHPVAQYAATLLADTDKASAQDGHLAYFEKQGEIIQQIVARQGWEKAAQLIRRFLTDFQAATRHCITLKSGERLLRLFLSIGMLYMEMGLWDEFTKLSTALDPYLATMPPDQRLIRVYGLRAALARRQGDNAAASRYWQQRFRIQEALQDHNGMIGTAFEITGQAIDEGDPARAALYLAQGTGILARTDISDFRLIPVILSARLAVLQQRPEEAATHLAIALSRMPEDSSIQHRLYACNYLGQVALAIRQLTTAETLILEGIGLSRGQDRRFGLGILLRDVGRLRTAQNRFAEAAAAYTLATTIHEDLESRYAVPCRQELETFLQTYQSVPEVLTTHEKALARPEGELLDIYFPTHLNGTP